MDTRLMTAATPTTTVGQPQPGSAASTGRLLTFVAIAYAVSWACWLPLAMTHRIVDVGGWPTHLPGLLGPAVAAVTVAFLVGRAEVRRLAAAVLRWRIGWWWLVAASPLALLGLGVAVQVVAGQPVPTLDSLAELNGFPTWGMLGVLALLVVVNGLGEETGWRGYLQAALQRRMRPLLAMLVVAVAWAGWHAPLFAIVTGYRSFDPVTLVGFAIGLVCGAVLLGWLYNRTGSVLAVAVWHATYNVASATTGAHGLPAAVTTTTVILGAVALICTDLATRGRVLRVRPGAGPGAREGA
jgi:membrane protease YdiL (CAAX protease family)